MSIKIQIFPSGSFAEYEHVLRDVYSDGRYSVEFEPNDSLMTSEGLADLPDAIQINLDPELAKLFFEYIIYVYAGKKIIDGTAYVGKKLINGIASEVGKDIYNKIKQSLKILLVRRKEHKIKDHDKPFFISLKGCFNKADLVIRISRASSDGIIEEEEIVFISQDSFGVFASVVLPVADKVIEIIGTENLRIVAELDSEYGCRNWTLVFLKTIVPNMLRKTFHIVCCFDNNGVCTTFGFDEENKDPDTRIPVENVKALKVLRDSILKKTNRQP